MEHSLGYLYHASIYHYLSLFYIYNIYINLHNHNSSPWKHFANMVLTLSENKIMAFSNFTLAFFAGCMYTFSQIISETILYIYICVCLDVCTCLLWNKLLVFLIIYLISNIYTQLRFYNLYTPIYILGFQNSSSHNLV